METPTSCRRRGRPKAENPTHGVSGYIKRKCRCDECRTAWVDYDRSRRAKAKRQEAAEHAIELQRLLKLYNPKLYAKQQAEKEAQAAALAKMQAEYEERKARDKAAAAAIAAMQYDSDY